MSQLTLRQIPDDVRKTLFRFARQRNLSLNKLILSLLRKPLGLEAGSKKKRDLSSLAGTWTTNQANELAKNLKVCEKIDGEIWS